MMRLGAFRHILKTSHLLLCVTLHSLCLEDLLCPSPLQRLQADPIHLIQEHRQETRLHTIWCLTV